MRIPRPSTIPFDLQGHRGARGLLPENTVPGFVRALELGVTTLEMDVVISKDYEVVVSHEPWFSGLICSLPSGKPVPMDRQESYRIFEMTYDEVVRYDCGRRGHPLFPRQQPVPAVKPLLRDVIAAAESYVRDAGRPAAYYNIETKTRPVWDGVYHPDPKRVTDLLHQVVVRAGIVDRTTLQSFDIRTLQIGRHLEPDWRLSLLVEAQELELDANLRDLGFVPDVLSPDYHLVNEALIAEARRFGMAVIPWTVNDPDEMRRLKVMGVDGLITDYPDVGMGIGDS
jgi:glycerophosphoryl diester phosphodiesterase